MDIAQKRNALLEVSCVIYALMLVSCQHIPDPTNSSLVLLICLYEINVASKDGVHAAVRMDTDPDVQQDPNHIHTLDFFSNPNAHFIMHSLGS